MEKWRSRWYISPQEYGHGRICWRNGASALRTGFNGMIIQRAKEWNDALSQHCDDMGLTGEEREQLVKIHLASPLARLDAVILPVMNLW